MARLIFFWCATILGLFISQMLFSGVLTLWGVFPHFLLLATIYMGVRHGSWAGLWTGFFWGMLADVASISVFGAQTFMLTLIGYSVGRMQGKVDEEKPVAQVSLVLACSAAFLAGLYFFESFFGGLSQRFSWRDIFLQPIYNAVAAPILFMGLEIWHRLWRSRR